MFLLKIEGNPYLETWWHISDCNVEDKCRDDSFNPEEGEPEADLGDGGDHVAQREHGDEDLEAGGVEDMNIRSDYPPTWRLWIDEHLDHLKSQDKQSSEGKGATEQDNIIPRWFKHIWQMWRFA